MSGTAVSGAAVVAYAERFQGYPYTTVGNSPATGFSCIGFVSYVYRTLGIDLPDDLGGAYAFASQIPFADLQPGDVLFFQNTVWAGLSHTAIYIGGGRMIHAEWYNRGVVISSFTNDPVDGNYWTEHYLGANRPWSGVSSVAPAPAVVPLATAVPIAPQAHVAPQTVAPRTTVRRLTNRPGATVRVGALNVRSRPSIGASIATVVTRGTRVSLLGHRWGWYRVVLSRGQTGWVAAAGIGKRGAPVRRVSARKTVARHLSAVQATVKRTRPSLTVAVNGLRVHARPSLAASVVGSVARGRHLTILGGAGGWMHVTLGRGTGWVSRSYVRMPGTVLRSIRRTPVQRAATTAGTSHTTLAQVAVNVRRNPTLTSPVLSLLVPGRSFHVVNRLNGWTHLRLSSGLTGWAATSVLSLAGAGAGSTRNTPMSTPAIANRSMLTAGVRLRYGPGVHRPTIRLVAAGTHVRVLGAVAGWDRVRLPNGRVGYVLGTYVQS
jgi:uncharacterized protein YgiM (DUF1202 family)